MKKFSLSSDKKFPKHQPLSQAFNWGNAVLNCLIWFLHQLWTTDSLVLHGPLVVRQRFFPNQLLNNCRQPLLFSNPGIFSLSLLPPPPPQPSRAITLPLKPNWSGISTILPFPLPYLLLFLLRQSWHWWNCTVNQFRETIWGKKTNLGEQGEVSFEKSTLRRVSLHTEALVRATGEKPRPTG